MPRISYARKDFGVTQGGKEMNTVTDPQLKIYVSNKKISYDLKTDVITTDKAPMTRSRKNGYTIKNEQGKPLGLVFMSDDKRTARYGDCEILFFKEHEKEYGSWRVIKMHGERFPFATLEKILSAKECHTFVIDPRTRKVK